MRVSLPIAIAQPRACTSWTRRLRAAVPLLAVGLTACQSLYIGGLGRGEMDKPLPPANRFVLPSADTDVVGELRVVIARQEDTLSDIACCPASTIRRAGLTTPRRCCSRR